MEKESWFARQRESGVVANLGQKYCLLGVRQGAGEFQKSINLDFSAASPVFAADGVAAPQDGL